MIVYKKFWETLKNKEVSTYELIEKHNINPNTLTRMRSNKFISTRTVNDFCRILECQVSDILEYVPDSMES